MSVHKYVYAPCLREQRQLYINLQGAAVAASICAILQQKQSRPAQPAARDRQEGTYLSGEASDVGNSKHHMRHELVDPNLAQCTPSRGPASKDGPAAPSKVPTSDSESKPYRGEDNLEVKCDEGMPTEGARTAEKDQGNGSSLSPAGATGAERNGQAQRCEGLQFAILWSAYVPAAHEPQSLLRDVDVLQMPSLHCFAQDQSSQAWQIPADESFAVQNWFQSGSRSVLRSGRAHAVPGDRQSISAYKSFIKQFVRRY